MGYERQNVDRRYVKIEEYPETNHHGHTGSSNLSSFAVLGLEKLDHPQTHMIVLTNNRRPGCSKVSEPRRLLSR
jgi:hypothetical protein